MPSGSPQPCFLSETGPDARNGLSLACNGSRSHGFHSRVDAPDLLLRFPALPFRSPFGFQLHGWLGSPHPGRFFALPVASSQPRFADSRATSTPLQGFCPLRIKAFNYVSADWPAFRFRPISSRSPNPALLLGFPSKDHRSRSATFPEACCSSNLLEPLSICSCSVSSSTIFCNAIYTFPQVFGDK